MKIVIVTLLILYFLFLVISRTPARLGASMLREAVPNLWLTGVTGTLWDGRASGAQIDIGNSALPLGEVRWQLNPMSLFVLNPCVSFSTEYPGQNAAGELCQSLGGTTRVKNASVNGSVGILSELIPDASIGGRASLQVVEGEFSGTEIHKLNAQLSWEQAAVNVMDRWLNFGSYAAKINENQGGGIHAKVFDLKGPYKIDFDANWVAASGWKAEGTVIPGPEADPDVQQGLQVVGEEVEQNTYKIIWP
ncbi:MAG: type II secretion system protein N [Cellvibrionaceae bacterium]|nr:type II secretion system protein N [Cellvibrionaceae bacterium]